MKRGKEKGAKTAGVLGGLTAILAVIGTFEICCIPGVVIALGVFGGVAILLSAYSIYFFVFSIALFITAAYLYQKNPKKCR